MQRIDHYIDGDPVEPLSGKYLDNIEPATGKVYSSLADGDDADVARAVEAAERAFPGWSRMPAEERSEILLRVADGIEAALEPLAEAESLDTGKPLTLARAMDIPRAASNFRFFATAAPHFHSEAYATDRKALNYTLRRPRGVAGLIAPWNLPLYLLSWKIAPALAVGNTAVAKPSELTPMTAFMLAEICREAGLPKGVLNIVQGRGATAGAALVGQRLSVTSGCRRCRSPAARRPAPRSPAARRRCSSGWRWSWEGRTPTSSSPTPISTRRSRPASYRRSPTRGRSACAARASSWRSRSTTRSSSGSPKRSVC
jgi:aminomuconate-semialdehyde/2-hydroxymuconate-6-semialdehyde dehydrogenase